VTRYSYEAQDNDDWPMSGSGKLDHSSI